MIITRKHLPRRTVLRGVGATLALPLLDAMVPAMSPVRLTAAAPIRRFGAIYVGMGFNMPIWTQPKSPGFPRSAPTISVISACPTEACDRAGSTART